MDIISLAHFGLFLLLKSKLRSEIILGFLSLNKHKSFGKGIASLSFVSLEIINEVNPEAGKSGVGKLVTLKSEIFSELIFSPVFVLFRTI